jgi:DNA-binding CsgD family transcriptional regulator
LPAFREGLVSRLRELVPCDLASYNEFGPDPEGALIVSDPQEVVDEYEREGKLGRFAELVIEEHPIAGHFLRTGETSTLRMSDFISTRNLHRLEIYDSYFGPLGTEHQLVFNVPARGQLIGVTVNRRWREYDERELALMNGLRQPVVAVHRNLHDRARLEIVTRALDAQGGGPVVVFTLEPTGTIVPAHAPAERLLWRIAGDQGASDALHGWAARRRHHGGEELLVLSLDGRPALQGRYLYGAPGTLDAIILSPLPLGRPQRLSELGLTNRQAEVLLLVWEGASNAEVALALCISEHTVRHHLEGIFRQLGVASRAGAAHLASLRLAADREGELASIWD